MNSHQSSASQASADAVRARDLKRMRIIATGLLVLMAAVYVAAGLAGPHWPGRGYVRAFAEAGMVGACADWFAVSALFRRPFGLPIPHTGIIPSSKARIGDALGSFIANNFLTVEVLDARVRQLELGRWGGEWLRRPANARRLSQRLAALISEIVQMLPADALSDLAAAAALGAARATPAAPAAGKVLAIAWTPARAQALAAWALDRMSRFLEDNAQVIEAKVEAQSFRWMPKVVDRAIAGKITAGVLQLLGDLRDPEHPWRRQLQQGVEDLIVRLGDDPELRAQGEALKQRLLNDPQLLGQARGVWIDAKLLGAADMTPQLAQGLETMLLALGDWLHMEHAAHARLNDWARTFVRQVLAPRRDQIGRFVAQVVAGWDTGVIVDKLELQVGKDLQYIRVNGTLVGGLVGLAIYALSQAFGL